LSRIGVDGVNYQEILITNYNMDIPMLGGQDISYGDFVSLSLGSDGEIAALESNMAAINRFKSEVTQEIIRDLEEAGVSSINIPLGSLIGNELTAGRGPAVEMKVYPAGFVRTELYSQFISAGINQTLHQVMLSVSVEMRAIIPGYNIKSETSTSFMVAQTVIVGTVPDTYVHIEADASPLFSRIAGSG
jgi:sporulation protein YunB